LEKNFWNFRLYLNGLKNIQRSFQTVKKREVNKDCLSNQDKQTKTDKGGVTERAN